jgi:D-glycero-alpha-D-manno-heptose-7-phosphate kinase
MSVRVRAPVRVLDAGGWTDTWFARTGMVCSVAVDDGAEIWARRIEPDEGSMIGTVDLRVPAFDDRYCFPLNEPPGRHPLLEAALRRWAPPTCQLEVTVTSAVPPGSSLGTSACVTVALIAALQKLAGRISDPAQLARAAHDIETVDLGLQSGMAHQIAAAHGGINLIMIDPYPQVRIMALACWRQRSGGTPPP